MQYDIFVTDFDGTLLRSDKTISSHTKETIEEFIKRGGSFYICTGRMFSSIRPIAKELGLKGSLIAYQGAMIGDIETGEITYNRPISFPVALERVKFFESEQKHIQIYVNDRLYVSDFNDYTAYYTKVCNVNANVINIPLSKFIEENEATPSKILVWGDKDYVKKQYEKNINDKNLNYTISNPYFLEMTDKNVSKGLTLKCLVDSMNKKRENVIAVGDNYNDISMIEYADLGCAVANATDSLKEKANYITASNDEDGVAKIIEKFCF